MAMYALKPIIPMTIQDIYKPRSMYDMKNIHEVRQQQQQEDNEISKHTSDVKSKIVSDITEQVIKFLKNPLPEVAELEIRQEKILTQLAELKKQVSNLCGILKSSGKNKSCSGLAKGSEEKISLDLVVNANPSKPPYSILALQKIWKSTDINVSTHVHSSSSSQSLEFPLIPKESNSDNNKVELSLIWKKVSDLETVISGVHGTPLLGEVNFLRYLSRLIESENYENSLWSEIDSLKIDGVLDLCHEISFINSPKDFNSALSILGSKLGNGRWLIARNEPSLADVAAWSIIKKLNYKKLPNNLSAWFKNCEDLFYRVNNHVI